MNDCVSEIQSAYCELFRQVLGGKISSDWTLWILTSLDWVTLGGVATYHYRTFSNQSSDSFLLQINLENMELHLFTNDQKIFKLSHSL
eukprot:UN07856